MRHQIMLDLSLVLRSPGAIIQLCLAAVIMLLLLQFGAPAPELLTGIYVPFALSATVITLLSSSYHIFDDDVHHDRITHWHYSRLSHEWMIASKYLCSVLCFALPLSMLFALIAPHYGHQNIIVIFAVIMLCAITTLSCGMVAAAISTSFRSQQLMAMIISAPFIFSVIIFGAQAYNYASVNAMMLLCISAIIINPLALLSSAMILRYYE